MIKVSNLYKNFGKLEVLRGISLEIKKGEVIAIIGPSGTGKSTLLRCINYLEQPDEGTISINGDEFVLKNLSKKRIRELRSYTSMVFQNYNLFNNMTVLENVMLPMTDVQKKSKSEAEKIAKELIKNVGLEDKLNEYPSHLSGGQQQRAGIARAMAVFPELMLFDEPTSSLDPEKVGEVMNSIRQLAAKHVTMLVVTHEMNFAREIADRIIFMDNGRILKEGTPKEFFENPDNERIEQFINKLNK